MNVHIFDPELNRKRLHSSSNLTTSRAGIMRDHMRDLPQKLRDARKRLGMSQAQFAQEIGASQGSVSKWEAGKEKPSFGVMVDISRLTGQPSQYFWLHDDEQDENLVSPPSYPKIVGAIEAVFSETVEWPFGPTHTFMVPLPEKFFDMEVEGYVIVGHRANKVYQEGDIVFVLSIKRYSLELLNDDILLVQRKDDQQLTELSLRRLSQTDETWLWPLTDDPEYQMPVVETVGSEEVWQVNILGVVVASFRIHASARREIELR